MNVSLTRGQRILLAGLVVLAWIAAMWFLVSLDGRDPSCRDGDPDPPIVCEYGIRPREFATLPYIYPAAFLHFGRDHLAANAAPLLILGFLVAARGIGRFLAVCAIAITFSGLGIWLTSASGSLTAGASGVVFGLFGYLLTRGVVERRALDITVGLLVLLCYGSILSNALPILTPDGVSWQGHFYGLAGGVVAARWLRRRGAAGTVGRQQVPYAS